ncbi:MAG TPA: NmrA family transcriptional regulator [Herpetosiphon sp.]|uniref:NmrA family protein n=1 Tax=Herpetosiphon aurantiacus (strain ATCC 23779 / DSM 785 / 114-95) TaxID=316274 RepID=A9B6N4_HERA2|nr:NmrA family NAD(P)-binding protein [Herpetosiphon sp.]ABX04343.1 NmrA family protein [Herpetosiphon aurantiacus DSM 785]HBW51947.1 NmrA family transcriptional regulator [Herpetosiphon sp.]
MTANNLILVTGGTGKTGQRIVARLQAQELNIRIGSRSASPSFDWHDQQTWPAALAGVQRVYICYQPDLAIPAAIDTIRAFCQLAVNSGVQHLVLLSGRGEPEAQACEQVVQTAGITWTIVRAGWFMQNFSESFFHEPLLNGQIFLPTSDIKEPFIDAEDIADVAVAALTNIEQHQGHVYEITGPRLMTFAEAISEIAQANGKPIEYQQIPLETYLGALREQQWPNEMLWLVEYLFSQVLDGRNAYLTDGVERALGRQPNDFSNFAREAAKRGVWQLTSISR